MKSLLPLKTWLYAKLSTDVSLTNLTGGVHIYDIVQENSALPYITYKNIISIISHQLDAQVTEHLIEFLIVAKADSSLTTHNIMARMEQIFDEEFEPENLADGYRILSINLTRTEMAQFDFEVVKANLQVKVNMGYKL